LAGTHLANRINGGANRVKTIQRGSAAAMLIVGLLTASLSRSDEPGVHHFDIAVQSLSSALNEFARQSQQQILFAPDLVTQKLLSPIHGDMQPIPALKLLLKDSGLAFKVMSNGVILVGDAHTLGPDAAPTVVTRSELNQDSGSGANSNLNSVIVEGKRGTAALEREARNYVFALSTRPMPDVLARWYKPICPLVGGLPRDEGEYVLTRLSRIATAAGASMAPEHCKPNFYVIVASDPNALMKEWSEHDPTLWDSHPKAEVRQFMNAIGPVRAFYNPGTWWGGCRRDRVEGAPPFGSPPFADCEDSDPLQDGVLASVIVLVDAHTTGNINFGQLTAYIAMAGLAQIRLNGNLGDASTILQLFSDPRKAPSSGLSPWDRAYLKTLYHIARNDKPQRSAIARSMAHEITP
jgi:hypothetical protein